MLTSASNQLQLVTFLGLPHMPAITTEHRSKDLETHSVEDEKFLLSMSNILMDFPSEFLLEVR